MVGYKDEFLRSDIRRSDEFFQGDNGFSSEFAGTNEYSYSNLNETEFADESYFHKDEFNMDSHISLKDKASGEGELDLGAEPSQTIAMGVGAAKVGAIAVAAVMSVSTVALNHEHVFANGWTVFREATCHHAGIEELICSDCGFTIEKRETDTLEHSISEWITQNIATCISTGLEVGKCSECGDVVEQRETAPTGHSWITTDNGMVCSVCGAGDETPPEDISSSSEIFEESSSSSEEVVEESSSSSEIEESSSSSEEVVEESSSSSEAEESSSSSETVFVPPVINGGGIDVPPTPTECTHQSIKTEVVTQPTCTMSGAEATICVDCGETISRNILSPTGHTYTNGVCGECGTQCAHSYVNGACTICKKTDSSSGAVTVECKHENAEVTTIDATCTDPAQIITVCECGYKNVEEISPATGHINVSEDGMCKDCNTFIYGEDVPDIQVCTCETISDNDGDGYCDNCRLYVAQ